MGFQPVTGCVCRHPPSPHTHTIQMLLGNWARNVNYFGSHTHFGCLLLLLRWLLWSYVSNARLACVTTPWPRINMTLMRCEYVWLDLCVWFAYRNSMVDLSTLSMPFILLHAFVWEPKLGASISFFCTVRWHVTFHRLPSQIESANCCFCLIASHQSIYAFIPYIRRRPLWFVYVAPASAATF